MFSRKEGNFLNFLFFISLVHFQCWDSQPCFINIPVEFNDQCVTQRQCGMAKAQLTAPVPSKAEKGHKVGSLLVQTEGKKKEREENREKWISSRSYNFLVPSCCPVSLKNANTRFCRFLYFVCISFLGLWRSPKQPAREVFASNWIGVHGHYCGFFH